MFKLCSFESSLVTCFACSRGQRGRDSFDLGSGYPTPIISNLQVSLYKNAIIITGLALTSARTYSLRQFFNETKPHSAEADVTMASVQNEQRIATCQSPRKRATSPRSESAEPAHHRSKRVKTEDQHREEISQEVQFADMPRDDLPSDIASERHEDDIATFAAQAEAAIASAKLALGIHDTEGSDNNVNELSNGTTHNATELPASPPDQSSNFEVDFSSAPSDPVDLALWVAKQISKFGNHPEDSAGIAYRQNSITHPPALQHRRFDEDDDPEIVAERERVREEARERKKRWRESNSERSMLKQSVLQLCISLTFLYR